MKTIITERDLVLLKALYEFEFLPTHLLGELIFSGINRHTVLRRLRKLEREKLIRKTHGPKGGELLWVLTGKGAQLIGEDAHSESINRHTLEHDVTLCKIRATLERSGIATSWMSEQKMRRLSGHKLERNSHDIIPDAIFAVQDAKGYQSMALELELSGKNSRRYRKIFSVYGEKSQFAAIWYVVTNQALGHRLTREWNKANPYTSRPQFRWFLLEKILAMNSLKAPAHPVAHQVGTTNFENTSDLDGTMPPSERVPLPHLAVVG